MTLSITAFLSYAHADDAQDRGRIVQLAEDLKDEYSLTTGADLELFLDRKSLEWGSAWRERIDEALDSSTFLLPVLTPRYFTRSECRREFLDFSARAQSRDMGKLVMPIMYVPPANFSETNGDEAVALASRSQYVDWTELRLAAPEDAAYRVAVNQMARRLAALAVELSERELTADQAEAGAIDPQDVGLNEVRDALDRLVPSWAELGERVEDYTHQFAALDETYAARRAKLRGARNFKAQELALLHRMATAELELVEQALVSVQQLSALTIELHPTVLAAVRLVRLWPEYFELLDGLVSAVKEYIEREVRGEARAARPGYTAADDFWRKRQHHGRLMARVLAVHEERNRLGKEANATVHGWAKLLGEVFHESSGTSQD